MRKWTMMVLVMVGAMGAECEFDDPCQDYVDYVCSCHADDPAFDCEELQSVFSDADPALQDQCAIDHAELEEEDQAEGFECAS